MAVRTTNLRPVQKKKTASAKKAAPKKSLFVSRSALSERDYFDYNLLAVVILLTCFGLIMLYSSSAYEAIVENNDDMVYFRKQAIISAAALVLALVGSQIDYHRLADFSLPIYVVSTFLLIITKFVGREVNGAKRWLGTSSFSFQPAELAKIAVILLLPTLIVKMGFKLKGVKPVLVITFFGAVSSFCTYYFTDNLSTAIIILGITVVLVFIAHPKTAPFVIAACVCAVGVALLVAWIITSDVSGGFRIARIQVWLHPEDYSSSGGYQILQALYAIGNGGFFGKGLGNSTQKLGSLPEAQNDMIFSIICEELGLFGAALVILLFVFLLYRLFFIAQNAPDLLGSLIVSGIFVHIALQVVLNIAVVTNLIPTTGITLPFISYGGTSILFLMAEMGLALGVSRQIKFK
ncbi:MAG: FtsW/RodA/SpoVE family cell cycle protein [Lachnospiraceae bacterium]|nr:FtsW/RodA/SpoVE family cell cycle protein [Lachnospiraceae bacterium]